MPEVGGRDEARSVGSADPDAPLGVGPVLADRYELGELLGRGGMAEVYRGFDRLLGRAVAVKVLREDADDDTALARFNSEARTLAGLSNPRLVVVLDAGFTSRRPFLVMELVEGPTLAQVIARGPVGLESVISIGAQVAEGLAYAHAAGVVHRDVKPGNVLVGPDGQVKLADFGIARLVGDVARHTQPGTAIGTAAYLAPEQVLGHDVTGAADVYSLGLVLLEGVAGERAFCGTPAEAAMARLHRAPTIPGELPDEFQTLLTRMLASDPAARPGAEEVAAELRAAAKTSLMPLADVSPASDAERLGRGPEPTLLLTRAEPAPTQFAPAATVASRPTGRLAFWMRRVGEVPARTRGVGAVLLALIAFLIVVALAAGGGDQREDDDVLKQVPAQLEGPLRDLHDAVNRR